MRWGTQDRVKVRKSKVSGDWAVFRHPADREVIVGYYPSWERAMRSALILVGLS